MQSVLTKGRKKIALDCGNRFISNSFSELESNYNPISGYQSVPLMSLEDAVRTIIPWVPDVMTYVSTAKEKCTKNTKLTINESAAIYLYTMESPFYTTINKRLRNENRSDLEPWFAYLKLFVIALWKLTPSVATVWRGVYGIVSSGLHENDIHIWWSINSCSRHIGVAQIFTCGNGTLFCIESIYGRDIYMYSAKKAEGEVVLLPGTYLRVKSISSTDDDISIIHLQQCDIIPQGKHVMLSYHENNQDIVSEIGHSLRSHNIPVWFNEKGDMFNIRDNLAVGVENAAVVCSFLTADYQASIHCKIELQYAQKLSRRIILCMLSDPNIWKPSDWLELITDSLNCVGFDVVTDTPDIDYITLELRCHIQEVYSSPKHVLPTTVDKSSYLCEIVKYEYLRKSRIERFINPAKSFPIEQSYINLVLVKARDQQEKEKQMHKISHDAAILGAYEDIYGLKTSIDVNDIFETCERHEKQVLVFGRAGIGKSTFCRFIAYQWAIGVYWPQYELLVVIQLRNLTTDEYPLLKNGKNYSLIDIVIREVFKNDLSEEEEISFKKKFDTKKTLWILDGYDEIAQNVPPHLKHLLNKLLETPHHILTSRPYFNTLAYKVQMEITGFTDENIQQYVQQFFDQMKDELEEASYTSETLFKHMKSNTRLWGVAHIPLMLELICTVWSNEDWSKVKNLTTTGLYTTMVQWLCRKYLKTQHMNIQTMSKNKLYQLCQQELRFLDILAFNVIKRNQIILAPELLEQAFEEADIPLEDQARVLNIGVLKSFNKHGTGTQIEMEKDHYFIHLSFQEYFAARYLVNKLKESSNSNVIEYIKYQKYNQRYALMFTFTAGLLPENQIDSTSDFFWNAILGEPIDLVGVRHARLIISCLEATYEHVYTPRRTELLQKIAQIIQRNLLPKDAIINNHLSKSLRTAQSVICDEIIVNVLVSLLQSDDPQLKTQLLSFIAETSISNPPPKLRTSIANSVDDKNGNVRTSACEALGMIGEKAVTQEMIDKLVSALTDENDRVRASACNALGNISEKTATKEVIDKLVSALTDENPTVRVGACDALGNISEKTATKEVIDKLVSAVTDKNAWVRMRACDALGKIGEKAVTKEMVYKFVSALTDENEWVRMSACDALGKIGEKAAIKEVMDKLVNALADENEFVRRNACDALRKIGEKAAIKEVIDQLVSALTDENEDVRMRACYFIGEIGGRAVTNEVIDQLVSALRDENAGVRRHACDALGKIGGRAVTNEVIDQLVSALTDENAEVRSSACDALGNIGEKPVTKEVIDKLLNAVTDENKEVRMRACYSIGKIGEKAATKEVIDKLVSVLTDKNEEVKMRACDALGMIGEKAVTKEVIDKLENALADEHPGVRWSACDALRKIGEKAATTDAVKKFLERFLNSNMYTFFNRNSLIAKILTPSILVELDPEFLSNYLLRQNYHESLKDFSIEQLLSIWLRTKNCHWLPIIVHELLLRAGAVVLKDEKLVVYEAREPIEVFVPNENLRKQLEEALVDQRKQLFLSFNS